jgi:hypothetical protein
VWWIQQQPGATLVFLDIRPLSNIVAVAVTADANQQQTLSVLLNTFR